MKRGTEFVLVIHEMDQTTKLYSLKWKQTLQKSWVFFFNSFYLFVRVPIRTAKMQEQNVEKVYRISERDSLHLSLQNKKKDIGRSGLGYTTFQPEPK